MEFTPHCNFDIDVKSNMMICVMRGLWNHEGMEIYFDAVKQKANPILSNKWIRIADISSFEGGPLELMEQLIEIQNWSVANNCIHLYLVKPQKLNEAIIEKNKSNYSAISYCQSIEEAILQAQKLLKE